VLNADLSIFDTIAKEVPSEEERKRMWNRAVREGLDFIIEKEKKELERIKQTIKKIKEQGEKSKEIVKILKKL